MNGRQSQAQAVEVPALDFSQLFGPILGENRPATPPQDARTDTQEYPSPTPWENPAEGQETPHSATTAGESIEAPAQGLLLQAEQEREAARRATAAYKEIEQNRRRSEALQAEILKGTRSGASIYRLFLTAAEAIAEMTRNRYFFDQVQGDILQIYGRGLGEPEPLQIELDRTRGQLHHLQEAQERETDQDSRERIAAAIRAHRARIRDLEGRIAAAG